MMALEILGKVSWEHVENAAIRKEKEDRRISVVVRHNTGKLARQITDLRQVGGVFHGNQRVTGLEERDGLFVLVTVALAIASALGKASPTGFHWR